MSYLAAAKQRLAALTTPQMFPAPGTSSVGSTVTTPLYEQNEENEKTPGRAQCASCHRGLVRHELERGRCSVCVNTDRAAAGLPIQVAQWGATAARWTWHDYPLPPCDGGAEDVA